jgi:PKHD-type hydroxylase
LHRDATVLNEIRSVLSRAQVLDFRRELEATEWSDGRGSAGHLSQAVKNNEQLPDTHPLGLSLGETVLRALERNALFISAALPQKIVPPLFNRYAGGQGYGPHIDGAVRPVAGTPHRVRTDLSATLFLSAPDEYDGGELVIEDTFGTRSVKCAAGDMILYPGSSVHRVAPVTRGVRYAAFFWVQSMVRGDTERRILFDLDNSIQALARDVPDNAELVRLAGVYHNLLRRWAEL